LADDAARQLRLSGPARSALIAYGVAAFAFIVPQSSTGSRTMLIVGLVVQVVVVVARILATRHGGEISATAIAIVELIADGVTVLLFAIATFMGILGYAAAV
jgi:hypothetical protein